MRNIIFKDSRAFSFPGMATFDMCDYEGFQLNECLRKLGFHDFNIETHMNLTPDTVKSVLSTNKDVGNFVIITNDYTQFASSYPNNTIKVEKDYDIEKICKEIIWIMTNFGREQLNMDNVWVTSDTHFNHARIIEYCNRPFASVEEMNEKLIENWNSVVKPDDKVIHLGDFAFGGKTKVQDVFKRLNGKIDLVMGNHDRLKIKDYYEMGFHRVYDHPVVYQNFFIMSHAPLQWIKDGDVYANLYGHVHDMEVYNTWTKNTCCACVERHGYKPISFEYIKSKFEELNK